MKIEPVYFDGISKVVSYIQSTPEWGNKDFTWVFNYSWNSEKYPYGYSLINDNGEIVGFLGTIYAERISSDQLITSCNLAAWVVDKEYRMYASLLLKKVINKQTIITNFTPNKVVVSILERMKFTHLRTNHFIVSCISLFTLIKSINSRYSLSEVDDFNLSQLNETDKKIFSDHKQTPCKLFILVDKKASFKPMLLVLFKTKAKGYGVANLAYISDGKIFSSIWQFIALQISCKTGCLFLGEFSHQNQTIRSILKMSKPQDMLVYNKSDNSDFLYSELVLNNGCKW